MQKTTDCKDAKINFTNTIIILVLTVPILFSSLEIIVNVKELIHVIIFLLIIIIDCIVMYYFAIRRIIRNIIVRKKGSVIQAIVMGYCDDVYSINEEIAQKLLLNLKTDSVDNNICYKLSDTKKCYEINSKIELYSYKDIYLIKNEKENKRQRKIIAIVFVVFIIWTLKIAVNTYIPLIFNTSTYEMKMNYIQKTNKEIMNKFNELEYEIPKEYSLSIYQKDWNYRFATQNNNHFCEIDILSDKSDEYPLVGKCKYYDQNKQYEEYDEVELNGTTWCYSEDNNEEKYMINDGKHYYSITLYNYKDNDETCYTSFNKFKESIKLNNN